jgi:glucosamine-6-phosphate deaminase
MRLNLSSYITLERVPKKYYRPENDFEKYTLTRFEKIPTIIHEMANMAAKKVAEQIVKEILAKQSKGEMYVLGISGGTSPVLVYEELVRRHKTENISFRNVVVFNMYEYYPVYDSTFSNLQFLKEVFLNQVDIDPKNI